MKIIDRITAKAFPGRFVRSHVAGTVADFFAGVFAMDPVELERRAEDALARVRAMPQETLLKAIQRHHQAFSDEDESAAADADDSIMTIEGDRAHIRIDGTITNRDAACARSIGMRMTSTSEIIDALRTAVADPRVGTICLHLDSPGGTLSGVPEAALAIAEATESKYCEAYVSCQCASAAYWMAAQANTIIAEPSAVVGSIGVFGAIADYSQAYEQSGIKVHLISSGGVKGGGVQGVAVSDEYLADQQRLVDAAALMFRTAVARGRDLSMEAVEALATGQQWYAEDAKKLGLIDEVRAESIAAADPTPPPASDPLKPLEKLVDRTKAFADTVVEANAKVTTALAALGSTDAPIAPKSPKGDLAETPAATLPEDPVDGGTSTMATQPKEPTNDELKAELEQLRKEKAEAVAKEQISAIALAQIKDREFEAVVDRHVQAGRVAPAQRENMLAAGKNFGSPAKLDEFLANLPTHLQNPTALGKQIEQKVAGDKPKFGVKDKLTGEDVPDPERKAFEAQFQTQIEKTQAFSAIRFGRNGTAEAVDRNGNVVGSYDKNGRPIS